MNRNYAGLLLLVSVVVLGTGFGCRSMPFSWNGFKGNDAPTGLAEKQAAEEQGNSQVVTTEFPQQSMEMMGSGARTASSQTNAPSQSTAPVLAVSGVVPNSGPIRIAVFSSADGFPSHDAAVHKLALESSAAELTCPIESQSETFAVAAFQDLNNDGVLNRSQFGIPSEPYGFSRNAQGQMGPPAFQDAAVSGESKVELQLRKLGL